MHLRRIGGGKGAPKTIGLISEPLVFGDRLKRRAIRRRGITRCATLIDRMKTSRAWRPEPASRQKRG
jgi:hypothetical protein